MSIGKAIATIFGGTFAAKAAREARVADLLQKNAIFRAELAAERENALAHEASGNALHELLAAEKIRHADTQRRLQATLEALDKARMENGALKEAEADRRIAEWNSENRTD